MATMDMSQLIAVRGREAVCPICGSDFVYYPRTWTYKLTRKGGLVYYCRYSCWREAAKE